MIEKFKNMSFDDYALFVGKVTIVYCVADTLYITTKGAIKLTKKVIKKCKEKKSK